MSKASKSTRDKIVNAAWKLFYKQGYDDTTIDDIIEVSHISKGTFYHYFDGKESLIDGIAYLLDNKYEDIVKDLDESLNPLDKLVTLTQESFFMIENTVPVYLLKRIMSSPLTSNGDKYLLNPDRVYFRVVRSIVIECKEQHIFQDKYSLNEICIAYALFERGLMYDWCVANGSYAFCQYGAKMMRIFLTGYTV